MHIIKNTLVRWDSFLVCLPFRYVFNMFIKKDDKVIICLSTCPSLSLFHYYYKKKLFDSLHTTSLISHEHHDEMKLLIIFSYCVALGEKKSQGENINGRRYSLKSSVNNLVIIFWLCDMKWSFSCHFHSDSSVPKENFIVNKNRVVVGHCPNLTQRRAHRYVIWDQPLTLHITLILLMKLWWPSLFDDEVRPKSLIQSCTCTYLSPFLLSYPTGD